MPNVALIPEQNASIDGLDEVVSGFLNMTVKLRTHIGDEPLEDGSNINDHAITQNTILILQGVVSDLSDKGTSAASTAFQRFQDLYSKVSILTVVTPWAVFEEMLIDRLDSHQQGRGMLFTLELRKIIRVGVESTGSAQATNGPARGRAPPVNRGRIISPHL